MGGHWKLLRKAAKTGDVRFGLFELERDQQEKNDIAEQVPKQVESMKAKLLAWQKLIIGSPGGEDSFTQWSTIVTKQARFPRYGKRHFC